MRKKRQEPDYKAFVEKKQLPIIILDPKWHELFPEDVKTPAVRKLETKLTDLLKQQGKLVNEIKDMKKLKRKLMNQIVANMGEGATIETEKKKGKKQEVSQKMILEINEQMEEKNDQLIDLPYKIREANELLVIECLKYWYPLLKKNASEIEKLDKWVMAAREELKQRLLLKQEKQENNEKIYSYMHNLLGHDVINKFDQSFVYKGSEKE